MKIKPPTAHAIDKACRAGFFVYIREREQVRGAVTEGRNMLPIKNRVWVDLGGRWECVFNSDVTVTLEPFDQKKKRKSNGS